MRHVIHTKMSKNGNLELKNLPFDKGTKIEIVITKTDKFKNIRKLISNNHAWSEEDIELIRKGREVINQWKIF